VIEIVKSVPTKRVYSLRNRDKPVKLTFEYDNEENSSFPEQI
jgi:hypothetical protein